MLTDIQLTYAQSLINTYRQSGYTDYILTEATRNVGNTGTYQPYTMFLYLTKGKFTAQSSTRFQSDDTVIRVSIDTTNYNANSNNDAMLAYDTLTSAVVTLQDYYTVYTNAEYTESVIYRKPDLLEREGVQTNAVNTVSFLLLVAVLTAVFIRILR